MKLAAIDAQLGAYPLQWMCEKFEVSRAGYYAWRKRPPSVRSKQDIRLTVQLKAAYKISRETYGSPRLLAELRAGGLTVGRKRVIRLMKENGLYARRRRKYVHTTNSNHAYPIAENLLARDFSADAPNTKWVGDITYIPTNEGWVYLATLVDLFSRKIVGWAVGESMHTDLALAALRMALLRRRPAAGLIHHTDRGSQYASSEYRREIAKYGIRCSMSRRADCWDNAPGESIFSRLKDDLVYRTTFESKLQAMAAIEDYIENFYNPIRRHSTNGQISPNDYESSRQK